MRHRHALGLSLFFAILSAGAQARGVEPAEHPVDVYSYGEAIPQLTREGEPFVNPFLDGRKDIFGDFDPRYPQHGVELIPIEVVGTAPKNMIKRGLAGWDVAAWGKYVFSGNFEEGGNGFCLDCNGGPIAVEDQGFGVYDSERRRYCILDLDPSLEPNASVQSLAVAEPENPSTTRIYFEGFVLTPGGFRFGFVEADMSRDPCVPYDPATPDQGWRVVGFTTDEIAAATPAGFATLSFFDGLVVLDPNTIGLGGWFASRIWIAEIDANGTLSVTAEHSLPLWQPPGEEGCWNLRPVGDGNRDPTRGPGDLRFTWDFDVSAANAPDPECSPNFLCASDGSSCSVDADCPNFICDANSLCNGNVLLPCSSDADCPARCAAAHPQNQCSSSGAGCLNDAHCGAGETCLLPGKRNGVLQEYSYDPQTASITPTSPPFKIATRAGIGDALFDSAGNLWTAQNNGVFDSDSNPATFDVVIWRKNAAGEHSYHDPSQPLTSTFIAPALGDPFADPEADYIIPYDGNYLGAINTGYAVEGPNWMLMKGKGWSLQWASKVFGVWLKTPATEWERWRGRHVLPAENDAVPESQLGFNHDLTLALGGSPPSVWTASRFPDELRRNGLHNHYLSRVPVHTLIPDSSTGSRPAIAWSGPRDGIDCAPNEDCRRLWLVSRHDFQPRVRARVNGFWSDWGTLPAAPGGVTFEGGAAVIATPRKVEVFARGQGSGPVYQTQLAAPLDCDPTGSCSWTPWAQVGGIAGVTADPAAAYQGTQDPILVFTRDDGQVYMSVRTDASGSWSAPQALSGLSTQDAPSIAWHSGEGRAWVAARDTAGDIRWRPVQGGVPAGSWQLVGAGPTDTPPAIAFDGARMRVLATLTNGGFSQKAWNAAGWSAWRKAPTPNASINQPAAVSAHGELNVVTRHAFGGLHQQAY